MPELILLDSLIVLNTRFSMKTYGIRAYEMTITQPQFNFTNFL